MPHGQSQDVARHFAADWKAYDQQIRQVIPYYDQALTTDTECFWKYLNLAMFGGRKPPP